MTQLRDDAVRFRAADSIQSQRLFPREIRYQRLCFLYKKAEVPSESATRPDYLEDACRPSSLGWYWLRLERLMCNMVCDGQIDIATAQAAFVTDWIAAYHTYYEARKKAARRLHAVYSTSMSARRAASCRTSTEQSPCLATCARTAVAVIGMLLHTSSRTARSTATF